MDYIFAPGCALVLYKNELAEKIHRYLDAQFGHVQLLHTCCRHTPQAVMGRCVINVCPGCDKRYRRNYAEPSTISLWELLADSRDFPFPDYAAQPMTIIDACPTRDQARIHDAVRKLAERMNITLIEPERTREKGTCCGDTFYDALPNDQVIVKMKEKAATLPACDVMVYCVSCSKSMFNGGRKPRYVIDLLFNEDTIPKTCDPAAWHKELDEFIATHTENDSIQRMPVPKV
jgi:Fe-S oxidoreductase